MVQLVATKMGLMSHDLLREKKTNSTNSFGKFLSWVFFSLLQLHGDRTAWRSEVPQKLIDQEVECEPRCRLDS
jgi:hypothetical protein